MSDTNPRRVESKRTTKETDVAVGLDLSGPTDIQVDTGLPFFDHLLTSMAFHGGFGLSVKARGDVEVDAHHLVEDTGLVLGTALSDILRRAQPVARFGHAVIPMDEALAEVTVDVCGRPTLGYRPRFPQARAGSFDLWLLREFFLALADQARISVHVDTRGAENSHHAAEAVFKALGRALAEAYAPGAGAAPPGTGATPRRAMSTKNLQE
jgi:imidazoleglycerol-phosphate dehydratase